MSRPSLTPSDKKLVSGLMDVLLREIREIREIREFREFREFSVHTL